MIHHISFTADIESQLQQLATATGRDIDAFLKETVIERLAIETPAPIRKRSLTEFLTRLQEIVDLSPGSNGQLDDRRESIYAGRGE